MPNVTTFEELYDLFLSKVQDYRMRNAFLNDTNVATAMLHKYLIKAIAMFDNCKKDIQNVNEILGQFNCTLDITEKNILTDLMVEAWLNRNIDDLTQININLNDTTFKHASEANNLDKKMELRDRLREITRQDMWMYDFKHTDFEKWASGNYDI